MAVDDVQVLYDFFKEGEIDESELAQQFELASAAVEELEFKNMLSAEEDNLNAVLQITAGAGGRKVAIGQACSCACTSCGERRTDTK